MRVSVHYTAVNSSMSVYNEWVGLIPVMSVLYRERVLKWHVCLGACHKLWDKCH